MKAFELVLRCFEESAEVLTGKCFLYDVLSQDVEREVDCHMRPRRAKGRMAERLW